MKKVKKNMIKYCFYLLLKNKSTITIHLQHTLYVRIDAVQSHCSWKETDRDSGINNVENVKRPRAVEWNVSKSMNPMHKSCSCSNCKQGAIFYQAFTTKVVEMIIVCCAMGLEASAVSFTNEMRINEYTVYQRKFLYKFSVSGSRCGTEKLKQQQQQHSTDWTHNV